MSGDGGNSGPESMRESGAGQGGRVREGEEGERYRSLRDNILTESVINWRHGRRLAPNAGIDIDSRAMIVGVLHFC